MQKQEKSFEQNIARVEEIVRALEQGTVPLEQSLALFEEGAGLIRISQKMLNEAEQTVVRLIKDNNGEPAETPFDGED